MMNVFLRNLFYLSLFSTIFCLGSCGKDENESEVSSVVSASIELPALREGINDVFVSHSTLFTGKNVTTYSMEYDKSKKHTRWVAFKYYDITAQTNWNRNNWKQTEWKGDPWQSDPEIPEIFQRVQSDFGQKGYDRGHICASSDRLYSKDGNEQTFYYTNMSPQKNEFNIGVWGDLEGNVRTWGRGNAFRDTLYVVKGGTIDKEEHIWKYINNDETKPVPKYYFMALLCNKGGTFKAIGFWMDQSITRKPALSECARTIDELEELTGLDFFHNLPDKLENAVESQYTLSAWSGLQ